MGVLSFLGSIFLHEFAHVHWGLFDEYADVKKSNDSIFYRQGDRGKKMTMITKCPKVC